MINTIQNQDLFSTIYIYIEKKFYKVIQFSKERIKIIMNKFAIFKEYEFK